MLSVIRFFVLGLILTGISVTLVELFKQKLNKNLLCVDWGEFLLTADHLSGL